MKLHKHTTDREFIKRYGPEDLRPIFEDKIREATIDLRNSRRFTPAQRDYLHSRMGKQATWAISFGERAKHDKLKAELAYWCNLYLKCLPEKHTHPDHLTDQQIDQARQFPTHQLYEGRLSRSGRNFKALCPFHLEKTPSFYFYADGGWYCFGCNVGGSSAIDYVMKLEKLSFPDAVRRLQ